MNILSIHTSHDGSITIIKNNKFLLHTQIDRFNHVVGSAFPSKNLLIKIKKLSIKFNIVLLTMLTDSSHWYWENLLKIYKIINKKTKFIYYYNNNHHLFHSYCAKATCGKNKFTVVIDGHGSPLKNNYYEQETIFKEDIPILQETNNIGDNYARVTAKLLNEKYGSVYTIKGTGKTMALSSYGNINKKIFNDNKLTTNKKDKNTQNYLANFQKETAEQIKKIMPLKNVNYTGGVAQNVLANYQFLNYKNFKIDPLCTDQGISLGSVNYFLKGSIKLKNPVYLGFQPTYNLDIFEKYKIINTTTKEICKILKNNPVAIFQGRSEQGQRGLGNRSLLMNAMHPNAVKLVNKIKKREWYRPFSPAILEEYAKDYYEIKTNSPYMLYVFKAKKNISSVTSVDGTSRIQTVSKKNNYHFYNLLKKYNEIYKIPLLLNTSLNLSGHTLVESLEDVKYMFDFGNLKYCYLPELSKLIFNPR